MVVNYQSRIKEKIRKDELDLIERRRNIENEGDISIAKINLPKDNVQQEKKTHCLENIPEKLQNEL